MSNQSIYINPKFRNAHINPNFLPKCLTSGQKLPNPQAQPTPTNIFVNPNFLRPNQPILQQQPQRIVLAQVIPSSSAYQLQQPVGLAPKFTQAKIISQTNRKLVRQPIVQPQPLPSATQTTATVPIQSSSSPLLRIGMRKLVRRGILAPTAVANSRISPIRHTATLKAKHTSRHSSNQYKFDRRPNVGASHIMSKHKVLRISGTAIGGSILSPKTAHRKLAYLNINGVFYKSTRNKLQRHDQSKVTNAAAATSATNASPGTNVRSFSVRGTKYTVSADGKRLQRNRIAEPLAASNANSPMRTARLDFGGLTYVQVAPGTFECNGSHRTRDHLTTARQKSINMLLALGGRTKSNVPCLIYQRLGKCRALERGRCPRVHDAKRVAICPKFLLGSCQAEPCLLSHAVNLSKMPTCKFFLAGICVRDDCPYLHKKLNAKADVCPDFVRGFCERAEECHMRHEFLCPEFSAKGACEKVRCPYPHTTVAEKQQHQKRMKLAKQQQQEHPVEVAADSAAIAGERSMASVLAKVRKMKARYTNAPTVADSASVGDQVSDEVPASSDAAEEVLVLIPSRPKLGALPSYIPF